jgi:hypothetical protein
VHLTKEKRLTWLAFVAGALVPSAVGFDDLPTAQLVRQILGQLRIDLQSGIALESQNRRSRVPTERAIHRARVVAEVS